MVLFQTILTNVTGMKDLLSAVNTTSLVAVVVNNVFANAEVLKDEGSKYLGGEEPLK